MNDLIYENIFKLIQKILRYKILTKFFGVDKK